ncbi:MAG: NUDIX domain-containing protein [Pseudomonadota bacterium]
MTNIVNAILVQNGLVMLARRSAERPAYGGKWSFPGGHVEPGESLEDALVRELDEELAVRPTAFSLLETINDPFAPPHLPVTYHMFVVRAWTGEPEIQDDEHSELIWLPPLQAAQLDDLALGEYRALLERL